jgi:hypothetical protein
MARKKKPGRPDENREKLTMYVQPSTVKKIHKEVDKGDRSRNTLGKVVDEKFK